MSELNNPLFENQREFLERQKDEYKNALMGDVDQIKAQGEEIGKKVALAGGVLLAGYLIKRLFTKGGKKKAKKVKAGKRSHKATPPITASTHAYDSLVHEQEDAYTLSSEQMPHNPALRSEKKGIMESHLGQVITQQLIALMLVYMTKKVEEYVSSVSENNDIAAAPVVVTEIETTEYIVPEEDAF
ncbi:hypothetical protein [Pontibacter liquoris]|uniref:hypothetical protein n=1 Tax=Pontibacter liquoris TaxID=2905677 RepID=UPI001FA7DC5A|nr:hypothetical protein [Pontibacter liquoris]